MIRRGCSTGPHGPADEPLHEGGCHTATDAEHAIAETERELLDEAAALRARAADLEARAARPTRLYLAGPVSSADQERAFATAATTLRAAGYEVLNPLELPEAPSWELRMRQTITAMLDCDGVAHLVGWPGSRSARIEVKLAREIGMATAWAETWEHEAAKARAEGDRDGSTD